MDDLTKYIQQKLFENNLDQRVNVIHLSDHGMSTVTPPSFINLTDFVRTETVSFYGTSPVLQVVPKDSSKLQSMLFTLTSIIFRNQLSLHIIDLLEEIHANLTEGAQINGHFKVYTPDDLPERWQAANAQRMGPLLVLADMEYAFQDMYSSAEWYRKKYNVSSE